MKVERHTISACCGKASLVFKTDRPISQNDIVKLSALGFKEAVHFTKAGILYMENSDIIATGPIGSDRLQIKCKINDCQTKVNDFETLLQQLG